MDFNELYKMSYKMACEYLINKYGQPDKNYFNLNWVKQRISRTSEGIYCHHILENEYLNLSEISFAKEAPFEVQNKENLLYCNAVEHFILHLLIKKENPDMSHAGVVFTLCNCNALYDNKGGKELWKQNCFKSIKNLYNTYICFLADNYDDLLFDNNIIDRIVICYPKINRFDLLALKQIKPILEISKPILNDIRVYMDRPEGV